MENMKKPTFSLSHIGINSENVEKAKNTATLLANLFGFEQNETEISIFVQKCVEVMKYKGFGTYGHIGFYTENVGNSMKYLEEKGIKFNFESAKYNDNDELILIYMEEEISGFAIHLTSKK